MNEPRKLDHVWDGPFGDIVCLVCGEDTRSSDPAERVAFRRKHSTCGAEKAE